MSTYWLSRNGNNSEGPFVESQLRSMWGKGLIAATDQVCKDGTNDWMPVPRLLGDGAVAITTATILRPTQGLLPGGVDRLALGRWEPEEIKPERTRWLSLLLGVLALMSIGVLGFAYFHDGGSALGLKLEPTVKDEIQEYVAASFADRNAEVVSVGPGLSWPDSTLYLATIRYKNPLGGPSIDHFVAQIASGKVILLETAREWGKIYDFTDVARAHPHTANMIRNAID